MPKKSAWNRKLLADDKGWKQRMRTTKRVKDSTYAKVALALKAARLALAREDEFRYRMLSAASCVLRDALALHSLTTAQTALLNTAFDELLSAYRCPPIKKSDK